MRLAVLCLLAASAACTRAGEQTAPFSFNLRDVTQSAAPQSSARGLLVEHQTGGDRSEGEWVTLDSYSGDLSLIPGDRPGFADRFCTQLRRYLQQRTAVTGEVDGGSSHLTVSRAGGPAITTVRPTRQCAYRITRGWVDAHIVMLEDRQRAFMHVSLVRF